MWTIEFWMGAVWTLLCLLTGGLIVFFLVCVLGDRPIPGYPQDPPDDDDEWGPDGPAGEWLARNTITQPFEANLLRDGIEAR